MSQALTLTNKKNSLRMKGMASTKKKIKPKVEEVGEEVEGMAEEEKETIRLDEDNEEKKEPEPKARETKKIKEEVKEKPQGETGKETKSVFWAGFFGFVLGGLLAGGVFYFKATVEKLVVSPTPTATFSPLPTPTPTPLDLSGYQVQVLNGSGVAGAAGKAAALLEEEGFKEVEVGNAERSDFSQTQFSLKEDVPEEVVEKVKEILADYNPVMSEEPLSDSSDYDIVVTVGQSD